MIIAGLLALNLASLALTGWILSEHRKQIDTLTSKIMAKHLGEYALAKQTQESKPQPKAETPKRVIDSTLGGDF